jgi:hypothetical protein
MTRLAVDFVMFLCFNCRLFCYGTLYQNQIANLILQPITNLFLLTFFPPTHTHQKKKLFTYLVALGLFISTDPYDCDNSVCSVLAIRILQFKFSGHK